MDDTFDPDAYLAQKSGSDTSPPPAPAPFDPDAYLASKAPTAEFDPNKYLTPTTETKPAPEQTPKPEAAPDEETPGVWAALRESYTRQLNKQLVNEAHGYQVFTGQKTLADFAAEAQRTPEVRDALDRLNAKTIMEGWSSPAWVAAKIGSNLGAVTPGLGYALGVGAISGPAAPYTGIAAFAGEAALANVVPSYVQAKKENLSDDEALNRAMTDTGIAAAFAGAMGLVGRFPLTGAAKEMIDGSVRNVLKRPMAEALVQLGVVQPSLMAGQDIATSLAQGKGMPSAADIATDMIIGTAVGFGIHETFHGIDKLGELRSKVSTEPLASEATIAAAAEAQRFKAGEAKPKKTAGAEPAAPGLPLQQEQPEGDTFVPIPNYDRALGTNEPMPRWYSQVGRVIAEKMPENASTEQVMGILRNSQIPQEMLDRAYIPAYLENQRGEVNKSDLLAHIEANAIQIREIETSDLPKSIRGDKSYLVHEQEYNWLPGPQEGRRELVMYTDDPVDVEAQNWAKENNVDWNKLDAGKRTAVYKHVRDVAKAEGRTISEASVDIAHWPTITNPIAHVRAEVRGNTLIPIEFQSLHQVAAKEGYIGERFRPVSQIDRELRPIEEVVHPLLREYRVPVGGDFTKEDLAKMEPYQRELVNKRKELKRERYKAETPDEARSTHISLPFKSDWQELAVKRMMRYAVDNGFKELGFPSGDMVALRLNSAKEAAGARLNYDSKIPREVKKWAKKLGMEWEYRKLDDVTPEAAARNFPAIGQAERFEKYEEMGLVGGKNTFNNNILVLKLNLQATEAIRRGMPYSKPLQPGASRLVPGKTLTDIMILNPNWQQLQRPAKKIQDMMNRVAGELGVTRAIEFKAFYGPDQRWYGRKVPGVNPVTRNYQIEVNLAYIRTERDLYASMGHEFGHVLEEDILDRAPDHETAAIFKAHEDWFNSHSADDMRVGDVRRTRDNFISLQNGSRAQHDGWTLSDLDPGSRRYFLSFEEWWAEQVSKWMTTDAKPLSVADGFFKKLANSIRKWFGKLSQTNPGVVGTPEQAVADFLNRHWASRPEIGESKKEQFDMDTKRKAMEAFDREGAPQTKAVPQDASSGGGRQIASGLGLGKEGEAMGGHADRMNKFYKLFASLPQIQQLNPHILQLANYLGLHRAADTFKNVNAAAAHSRLRQWGMLSRDQLEKLTKAIDIYGNGLFDKDVQDGQFRRPTQNEFNKWVKANGLSDQSVRLFQGMVQDFDGALEQYRAELIRQARESVKDPQQLQINLTNVNARIDKMLQRPFMPITHFGEYLITVYDSNGKIRHSESTNSLRRQKQIKEALEKSVDRLPGDVVLSGMVPKDSKPFLGLPPGMVKMLADKLSLSDQQRQIVDQLSFDYAPGQSFKHQFKTLDLVPGYSTDFQRNYAHFFHHFGNHLARVKFGDMMRDQINSLRGVEERLTRAGNKTGANKLDQIANYMDDHYNAWVDPKSDWAGLRGIMFHWYLGFNPASAATNLTQTPLMTYPWLASKFGDIKAIKSLFKASTDLQNFHKKGTLAEQAPKKGEPNTPENFIARALNEAVTRGSLSETQAHQLAAISEDRNLLRQFGKPAERFALKFQEISSWLFEMTEQFNRRLAFRAALDLAFQHPSHKLIAEAKNEYHIQFDELVNQKGWTEQEAGAFVTAQKAVAATQFEYAQFARPPIMRGKIGSTALVFKLFTQNTLFNLASNPQMLWRWMMVMGFMGGFMGMPGAENINSFLKTMAYRLFGKDFDLEDQGRHFAQDVLNGAISPDVLMHGLSVKGFGLPAVMHSMGVSGFPTVDMSKSVGLGNVLGFDPFKPLGPVLDPQKATLQEATRAAGAAFSLPLNIYDASSSNDNFGDLKKYETWMPRFMGNLSHFYRYLAQGKEVNRAGNAVVRFDPHDTEQMMEILARAGGFQPRRLTEEWGRISARAESSAYWQLRKQGLMKQFAEAVKSGSQEDKDRLISTIKEYNSKLPDEAKGYAITSQGLRTSVQNRMRAAAMSDEGLPSQKRDIPIAQSLEPYYPRGWPKDLQTAKRVQ